MYGELNQDSWDYQEVATVKVIVHENYSAKKHYANDIALLKLEKSLSFNGKSIGSVLLPPKDFEVSYGKASVVGWGLDAVREWLDLKFLVS